MIEDTRKIVDKILIQAQKGNIQIDSRDGGFWLFPVNFSTRIKGQDKEQKGFPPTINIPDYDLFIEKVNAYLEKAKQFYDFDQDYFDLNDLEFGEKLFMDLMINITHIDCVDIYNFIDKRSRFLDFKPESDMVYLGNLAGAKVNAKFTKHHSNLEAPYKFQIALENEENKSELPYLTFAIDGNKAYVYAIQNKQEKNENPLSKKVDRYLRKLNKGVDMDDMVANISTNALASLVLFSSYMKTQGIKEIIAPDYMPGRDTDKYKFRRDEDQFNMTNKFMYLFLRYNYHFDTCTADYDDLTHTMHLNLNNDYTKTDNIICSLDEEVKSAQKEKMNIER